MDETPKKQIRCKRTNSFHLYPNDKNKNKKRQTNKLKREKETTMGITKTHSNDSILERNRNKELCTWYKKMSEEEVCHSTLETDSSIVMSLSKEFGYAIDPNLLKSLKEKELTLYSDTGRIVNGDGFLVFRPAEDELIGFAIAYEIHSCNLIRDNKNDNEKNIGCLFEIVYLFVTPDYLKSQVINILLGMCEYEAKTRGIKTLIINPDNQQSEYSNIWKEKHGFKDLDTSLLSEFSLKNWAYCLSKSIGIE